MKIFGFDQPVYRVGPRDRKLEGPCRRAGWQPHAMRGAFAGALKKKLGLTVTSEKVEGGERVYRLG